MKPALLALASLAVGVFLGWNWTRLEFAGEVLPIVPDSGPASPAATGGPRAVVVDGEHFNFGTMGRMEKDKHVFVIRNEGNAPLELSLGKTSCKCTLSNLADNRLLPGQTTDVELEWTVNTSEPMFEQHAEVITNDPLHNPLHLTIHGNVIDTLRPEDFQFTLNDLSANEPTTVRLRVFAYRNLDLQVVEHRWSKPENIDHLEVSFEPLSAEEVSAKQGATSGVAIVLHVKPGLPLGPLSQSLRVAFNLKNLEPLEFPLMGTVVSDIGLAGPGVNAHRLLINLGTLKAGTAARRTAYLIVKGPYREETKIQLVGAEPARDFLATLGEPLRDNPRLDRYPLSIEIPATALPVARNADESCVRVKFQATHPQVKELTVLVRYVVKE